MLSYIVICVPTCVNIVTYLDEDILINVSVSSIKFLSRHVQSLF